MKAQNRKATPQRVVEIVTASRPEIARQELIARTAALCECSPRTAQNAVTEARELGWIQPTEKPTARGGKPAVFYTTESNTLHLPNQ